MDDEIPHSTGRGVVRGPRAVTGGSYTPDATTTAEAPSAAAERIVSPIYDHDVICEGVVVSRDDLERLRVTHAEFSRFVQEAQEQRSRADGYALLVGEYRAALRREWTVAHDERCGSLEAVCDENPAGCLWGKPAILAADPEARADLEGQG